MLENKDDTLNIDLLSKKLEAHSVLPWIKVKEHLKSNKNSYNKNIFYSYFLSNLDNKILIEDKKNYLSVFNQYLIEHMVFFVSTTENKALVLQFNLITENEKNYDHINLTLFGFEPTEENTNNWALTLNAVYPRVSTNITYQNLEKSRFQKFLLTGYLIALSKEIELTEITHHEIINLVFQKEYEKLKEHFSLPEIQKEFRKAICYHHVILQRENHYRPQPLKMQNFLEIKNKDFDTKFFLYSIEFNENLLNINNIPIDLLYDLLHSISEGNSKSSKIIFDWSNSAKAKIAAWEKNIEESMQSEKNNKHVICLNKLESFYKSFYYHSWIGACTELLPFLATTVLPKKMIGNTALPTEKLRQLGTVLGFMIIYSEGSYNALRIISLIGIKDIINKVLRKYTFIEDSAQIRKWVAYLNQEETLYIISLISLALIEFTIRQDSYHFTQTLGGILAGAQARQLFSYFFSSTIQNISLESLNLIKLASSFLGYAGGSILSGFFYEKFVKIQRRTELISSFETLVQKSPELKEGKIEFTEPINSFSFWKKPTDFLKLSWWNSKENKSYYTDCELIPQSLSEKTGTLLCDTPSEKVSYQFLSQ